MFDKGFKKIKTKDRRDLSMGGTDKMGSTRKTNPTFSSDDSSGMSSLSIDSEYQY
jgi:hypothetical protein